MIREMERARIVARPGAYYDNQKSTTTNPAELDAVMGLGWSDRLGVCPSE